MSSVNPPPLLRIPHKLYADKEARAFFEGIKTILFQLWTRTGGSYDSVSTRQTIDIASTDTILDNSAYGKLIIVDASSAAVQITLPLVANDNVGQNLDIAIIDASFDVTIVPSGGMTIFGDVSVVMTQQYMSIQYTVATKTTWIGT